MPNGLWIGVRTRAVGIVALALGLASTGALAETLTFQEGTNGYEGTEDLHLSIPANFTGNGHIEAEFTTDRDNPVWEWDTHQTSGEGSMLLYSESPRYGLGDHVGLLRFRNLFGENVGQIPPGSTISAAMLTLRSKSTRTSDSANLHRILTEWDESTRWNDFGIQPGPDYGTDFDSQIELATGSMEEGDVLLDVTSSVAAWSQDPSSNRGWLFMPTHDQDIITVSGSSLANVTEITVDLEITTPQRGEITVNLRHEEAVAVLINRLGRSVCTIRAGVIADDIDVTIDPNAAEDIQASSRYDSPLTGTWRPDALCVPDRPLCGTDGEGGLCGKPADGDWVLHVADEWVGSGDNAVLVSWSIHLSDGEITETYTSNPNLTVEKRERDGGTTRSGKAQIYSSEAETSSYRPELSVTYTPAVAASPAALAALPSSGSQAINIRIPEGANATVPITVTVTSDDNTVAWPNNSPLVFAAGGPTHLDLWVAIGSAGSTQLTTSNDGGLPNIEIPVTAASSPIAFSSLTAYATLGEANPTVSVQIPLGSNAASDVTLDISSSDPQVADAVGAEGGTLTLVFPAGGAAAQDMEIDLGTSGGSAALTAVDSSGVLADGSLSVIVREDPLVEYDLHIAPYVQIGNSTLGSEDDQFVVAWETLARRTGGPNADRFEFQYRRVGDPSWTEVDSEFAPLHADSAAVDSYSASRLHHVVTVSGLDFDTEYEYQLIHYRNNVPLAGETFEATTSTRPTSGPFRFTAFGNSGMGTQGAYDVADLLASQGTDLHLLLGDNVYNFGEVEHYRARIFDLYGDLMKSSPFVATIGNHEYTLGLHFYMLEYFHLPENGPALADVDPGLHFSFDYGDVHFVGIYSGGNWNTLATNVSAWLAADLAASNKTWKIVFTHEFPVARDPYEVERPETEELRNDVLAVAVEAGADLYISGAPHSFQRYLPISAVIEEEPFVEWATCDQGFGTTLIYPGGGSWSKGVPGPIPDQLDPPMEFYLPDTGLGLFDVGVDAEGKDILTATLMDTDGEIMDQIELKKCWAPEDCPCEGVFFLYGTAFGDGPVEVVVDAIAISVNPAVGTSAVQVVADLADLINADTDLAAQGISATATSNRLDINAPIQSSLVGDAGLSSVPTVPALAPGALLALAAVLGAAALCVRRRRARASA